MKRAGLCCWLALAGAGWLAARSYAAPRVTEQLQNASLPETVAHLTQDYGLPLRLPVGSSRLDISTTGRRVSFDWRNASIGTVLRDLGTSFQVSPVLTSEGISLEPGCRPERGLGFDAAGTHLSLRALERIESRSGSPAGGHVEVSHRLRVTFAARSGTGDPDEISGIDRLSAVDDRGNELRLTEDSLSARERPSSRDDAAPDEWSSTLELAAFDPRAQRLARLDGELLMFDQVRSYRLELPLSNMQPEPPTDGRKVAVKLLSARKMARSFQADLVLESPGSVSVGSVLARPTGTLGAAFRLPDRSLIWTQSVTMRAASTAPGMHSQTLEVTAENLPASPTALVLELTEKSQPLRAIPFHFSQVPLPDVETSPTGGALRVLLPRPPLNGEKNLAGGAASLGVSRRTSAGWAPFRWTALEADERGELHLDNLEPGEYRVRIVFRARGKNGASSSLPASAPATSTVTIRAGKVTTLPAGPTRERSSE